MRRFRFVKNPLSTALGNNVQEFLEILGGPACLFLEGEDGSRTRALVTLLHGNEPSGAIALHRWLRSGQRPAVNVVCVLASVAAALEPPPCAEIRPPGTRGWSAPAHWQAAAAPR